MTLPSIGLTSWRLPGLVTGAPSLAASVGAASLQVDYGGVGRNHELRSKSAMILQLRREASNANIPITTVALNGLNDIGVPSSREEDTRQRNELFAQGLAAALELGADTLLVPAFRRSAMNSDIDVERTAAFLRQAAALASDHGLTIAHENVLRPPPLRSLLDAVPASNLTILFDIGNLIEHGTDPVEYLNCVSARLHPEAHLKDFQKPPAGSVMLGQGTAPLTRTVAQLIATGHLHTFVIETDHRKSATSCIEADVSWLRNLLTEQCKGKQ